MPNRTRTCSWPRPSAWACRFRTPSWSATASWDLLAAQRARALSVGLLSGGYGQEELEKAGAYRVYQDPRDMLDHLDEIGVRRSN